MFPTQCLRSSSHAQRASLPRRPEAITLPKEQKKALRAPLEVEGQTLERLSSRSLLNDRQARERGVGGGKERTAGGRSVKTATRTGRREKHNPESRRSECPFFLSAFSSCGGWYSIFPAQSRTAEKARKRERGLCACQRARLDDPPPGSTNLCRGCFCKSAAFFALLLLRDEWSVWHDERGTMGATS